MKQGSLARETSGLAFGEYWPGFAPGQWDGGRVEGGWGGKWVGVLGWYWVVLLGVVEWCGMVMGRVEGGGVGQPGQSSHRLILVHLCRQGAW